MTERLPLAAMWGIALGVNAFAFVMNDGLVVSALCVVVCAGMLYHTLTKE